jgi:hypothetical protein
MPDRMQPFTTPSTPHEQPVAQAEFQHQRRSQTERQGWIGWGSRLIIGGTYALTIVLFLNEIADVILYNIGTASFEIPSRIFWAIGSFIVIPVGITFILHFQRMFQTLTLAVNSIARERQSNNWDMLILTGIDAGKIVRGKWWATVCSMWGRYARLGILRAMLIIVVSRYANGNTSSYQIYSGGQPDVSIITPTLLQFLMVGVIVFALTIANLLFTAACGVTAFNQRSGVGLARAIGTRILILIATGVVGALIAQLLYELFYPSGADSIVAFSLLTLFDNGVSISGEFATSNPLRAITPFASGFKSLLPIFLSTALIALALYGLLTFILLRSAQRQAVRHNALPAPKNSAIRVWVSRFVRGGAYLLTFVLFLNEITDLIFFNTRAAGYALPSLIVSAVGVLVFVPIGITVILHFRRMFQTLRLAANSMTRERQINNGDKLVLTGIEAGKIVRGKWWATVRSMWRHYAVLGIMRAILIVWGGRHLTQRTYLHTAFNGFPPRASVIFPTLLQFLLIVGVIFALTMANLLFTAACGVSSFNQRGRLGLIRAIATRFLILIVAGFVSILMSKLLSTLFYPSVPNTLAEFSLLTVFDNGLIIGSDLAATNATRYLPPKPSSLEVGLTFFLPAAIIALLIYLVLTFVLLRLAQRQTIRQNALPPAKNSTLNLNDHA